MKKCLNGFLVMLIILICPILKVNALNIEGVYYDLPDLPTTKKSDYYTIAKNNNNDIYLIFFDNVKTVNSLDNSVVKTYYYLSLGGGSVSLSGKSYSHNVYYYKLVDNAWSYINYGKYDAILYDLENDIGITSEEWMSDINLVKPYLQDKILYTNLNYFACEANINNCELFFSNEDLKQQEYLKYSSSFANDLEGNSIYNIRFNAINYNSNYQYLIKTSQEKEWTNITENLNNEAFQYDYIIKYNTTLYMQVLDPNSNVLETKTLTIADLEEYGFIITHNLAEDLNTRPVYAIRVDARLVYNENYTFQYSYDNQKYYNMNFTDNVYIMNHALNIPISYRILDNKGNIIHTQIYGADFSEMERKITFNEKTNIIDNKKQIIIGIDFTEYLKFYDMYNFRVFIEDKEYNLQDAFYVELILTEENYVKALDIELMLDNMTIEQFQHRLGTLNGTGGGSDTDFNGMYDNVLENELENEIKEQDYTTISGMVEAVKNFIKATSEFITIFFELIMYFFNKLNIWIRTCIIALFIELILFKTIKAVRK